MSANDFGKMRVWAMLTGLVLAGWFFGELSLGIAPSTTVPMLLTAIGGFELFLFSQDMWLKKRKGRVDG